MRGMMRLIWAVVTAVLAATPPAAARAGEGTAPAAPAIVETGSPWRCFVVRGSELALKEAGGTCHLYEFDAVREAKAEGGGRRTVLNEVPEPRCTPFPPAGWREPDFDDGSWAPVHGPQYAFMPGRFGMSGSYLPVVAVCLRARFGVEDPARAGGLKLSLEFEGGAAVYLNGRELKRAYLPEGELKLDAPAEAYPKDASVAPGGELLRHRYGDPEKHADRYKMRVRRIADLAIPASALRKGVNVLAVEIHRAPGNEAMFTGRAQQVHASPGCWWNRVGLVSLRLEAVGGAGLTPAGSRTAGLRIWNHPVSLRVTANEWGEPLEPLRPVRIEAPRGGVFSGKVLVGSAAPIAGLKASAGDLTGPGTIPAARVRVRYARADGMTKQGSAPWFDSLEDFAPDPVPALANKSGALQPVWVTVDVPGDAKPGDYRGRLALSAAGAPAVEVPLELHVADWQVPAARDFVTHVGLIQSPESLAVQYDVPLWGEKHWALLDRTFALLGQVGVKTVYLTLVRRTHFGNEHALIRFRRGAGGKLEPDLELAEKYLALAVKHLGKVPVVGVYCWEPPGSAGHFGKYEPKDREILLTVTDGAGKLEEAQGPAWGTPECQEFWNATFKAVGAMLARHGVEKSMMFAMAGDYIPTKTAVEQLRKAAPETTWAVQCHPHRPAIHGVPAGYLASVWGVFGTRDPALPEDYYGNRRYYGWKNPLLITGFPRAGNPIYEIFCTSPIVEYRFMAEGALVSAGRPNAKPPGVRGFGRVGADFWPVLKDSRGRGSFLCGRYPETGWGQLNLAYSTPYVLAPGRDGAVATARFEMLREGLQEAEARVFIEKVLLDPAAKAKLGDELAGRCQELLDERVRTFMRAGGVREKLGPDWTWYFGQPREAMTRQLFEAAAAAAGKE